MDMGIWAIGRGWECLPCGERGARWDGLAPAWFALEVRICGFERHGAPAAPAAMAYLATRWVWLVGIIDNDVSRMGEAHHVYTIVHTMVNCKRPTTDIWQETA